MASRAGDAGDPERLRRPVGPSETSIIAVRADIDEARRVAREAEAEATALAARITELSVQVSHARQVQDLLQRQVEMTPTQRWADRVERRWRSSVVSRLRRPTQGRATTRR